MIKLIKRILNLELSDEEVALLNTLNSSKITSRKVVGRGLLTLDPIDITKSDSFKEYTKLAAKIVSECKENE